MLQVSCWEYLRNQITTFVSIKEKKKYGKSTAESSEFSMACKSSALNPAAQRCIFGAKTVVEQIRDAKNISDAVALQRMHRFIIEYRLNIQKCSWYQGFYKIFSGDWRSHYRNDCYVEEFLDYMSNSLCGIDLRFCNPETIVASVEKQAIPKQSVASREKISIFPLQPSVVQEKPLFVSINMEEEKKEIALEPTIGQYNELLEKANELKRRLREVQESSTSRSEFETFKREMRESYVSKSEYSFLQSQYRSLEARHDKLLEKYKEDILQRSNEDIDPDDQFEELANRKLIHAGNLDTLGPTLSVLPSTQAFMQEVSAHNRSSTSEDSDGELGTTGFLTTALTRKYTLAAY